MAANLPSNSTPLGWQIADASGPQAFYRGESATDAPAPSKELCRLVRDRIEHSLNGRVRDLDVEYDGDGIVLSGRCASFHTKQLAQHAALSVLDNTALENRIEVLVQH